MCVRAKSLQSCPTLCSPMDYSPPGSSVHGILQARILEWVAIPSSRGSSPPRDQTGVSCDSCTAGGFFSAKPPGPRGESNAHTRPRACRTPLADTGRESWDPESHEGTSGPQVHGHTEARSELVPQVKPSTHGHECTAQRAWPLGGPVQPGPRRAGAGAERHQDPSCRGPRSRREGCGDCGPMSAPPQHPGPLNLRRSRAL